jgi:hypothetical protein
MRTSEPTGGHCLLTINAPFKATSQVKPPDVCSTPSFQWKMTGRRSLYLAALLRWNMRKIWAATIGEIKLTAPRCAEQDAERLNLEESTGSVTAAIFSIENPALEEDRSISPERVSYRAIETKVCVGRWDLTLNAAQP